MLFSSNDILTKPTYDAPIVNESLIPYALEYMSESDQFIRSTMQSILGKSLLSENSIQIFNESFDFVEIAKSIIDFFIDTIKKLWQKFTLMISKLVGSDKVLLKHKEELLSYSHTVKVYFDHYRYNNLEADIPPSSLEMIFQDEYDLLYEDLQKVGGMNKKELIISELNKIYQRIKTEDEENYYNILRRKVLGSAYQGSNQVITERDYLDELKLVFHSNMIAPSGEDIPSYEVAEAAHRYFRHKELKESIKLQKKNIERSAGRIQNSVQKISPENFLKNYMPIDYEIEYALRQICQLESGRLSKSCNILVLAYSTKLNELKSAIAQDRKVLFEAVKDIIKGD